MTNKSTNPIVSPLIDALYLLIVFCLFMGEQLITDDTPVHQQVEQAQTKDADHE